MYVISSGVLFNSKETKRDDPKRFETDTLDYDGSVEFWKVKIKSLKMKLVFTIS